MVFISPSNNGLDYLENQVTFRRKVSEVKQMFVLFCIFHNLFLRALKELEGQVAGHFHSGIKFPWELTILS